jgi:multiple sugar transport system permease protein
MNNKFRNIINNDNYFKWILLLPAIIVMLIFVVYPLIYVVTTSFQQYLIPRPPVFIGVENYRTTLNSSLFWQTVGRSFLLMFIAITVQIILGLLIALLFNREFKGENFVRGLCLLPVMGAPFALSLVWRYMYDRQYGVFNSILSLFNVPPIGWLNNRTLAFFSVIVIDVWQWTPLVIFILVAMLKSFPKDPFEAAKVDGASSWFVFRKLTFPMLTPGIIIVILLRMIELIKFYDPLYGTTRGGPGSATETISLLVYRIGFVRFDIGSASSMAVIILYITMIITVLIFRQLMKAIG